MSYFAWGIMEFVLYQNEEGLIDPAVSLWTAWDVAPDNSKVSWTLREGVQFHNNWGEMTAEDVVFSFNNAIEEGTRFYGVQEIPWMGESKTTGKYTGEMSFAEVNPRWVIRLSDAQTHQPWIISKKLYDEKGEDEALTHMVGSGPYTVTSYASRDRVELEAVDHWRVVPKTKFFEVVEIAEPLVFQAAFLTGEVDIAPIPSNLIKDTLARTPGATFRPIGRPTTQTIHYTGNFWLKGELLNREGTSQFPRPAYAEALAAPEKFPWIGNIDDPESMERARKVRVAMTMATDQESIVRNVFDGFGTAHSAQLGFLPGDPYWKDEWDVPAYDPEGAKALLAEAGYPDGFSFPMFIPVDVAPDIIPEAGYAVAQMWRDIGLDPVIDASAYGAARDRRFDGQDNIIRLHLIATGDLDGERGEGMGRVNTWYSTELPREILDTLGDNVLEPDQLKRIQNNMAGQDFISKWRLFNPLAVISYNYMFRPEILDHQQQISMSSRLNSMWTVEVKR
jgi:ABC-type transport system substrate-binding protein